MAFNYPYQTLNIEMLRHLSSRDNGPARKAFIDCLAMLQEMLLSSSSSPIAPHVEDTSVAESIIEEILSDFPPIIYVARSAYDTISEATRQSEMADMRRRIIEIIRKNRETATELRREHHSPSGPPLGAKSIEEVAGFLEAFITSLVTQYANLRYPNTQAMPAK